jgi:hypothetical protein
VHSISQPEMPSSRQWHPKEGTNKSRHGNDCKQCRPHGIPSLILLLWRGITHARYWPNEKLTDDGERAKDARSGTCSTSCSSSFGPAFG